MTDGSAETSSSGLVSTARQRRPIVIISPHFDDVPLSLGEALRTGSLSNHNIRIRVAFGSTNWTSWVHPTARRSRMVSAWRKLEESAAAAFFGYRWTSAGWPEVVLRTNSLDSTTYLDPSADLSDEPLVDDIASWLAAVLDAPLGPSGPQLGCDRLRTRSPSRESLPDVILVPSGLGGHRDHLIIATAAARLISGTSIPIGFYEDRPYSAYLSAEEIAEHVSRVVGDVEAVTVSAPVSGMTQWLARACYPSQMTEYFTEAMHLDRSLGVGEKVWFPVGTTPSWLR